MTTITLDQLTFEFPSGWQVAKFDDWVFYTRHFQSTLGGGVKAADLIAIDTVGTAWFIEVKDYRFHPRTKPSCVAQETAEKVFDTLAALLPARVNSPIPSEVAFTTIVHGAGSLRAVLHLEQPPGSALFPVPISPMNIELKLRQLLRAVDSRPIVCDMSSAHNHGWSVRPT
jgi:hypothetical protein